MCFWCLLYTDTTITIAAATATVAAITAAACRSATAPLLTPQLQAFPGMKIYDLDTVFVARNETEKQHFSITMDVVKQSNMASSRQTLSMKDAVPPMHSQLFGVRMTSSDCSSRRRW